MLQNKVYLLKDSDSHNFLFPVEVYHNQNKIPFTHVVLAESTLDFYQKKTISLESLKILWSQKMKVDLNQIKINLVDASPVDRGYELYLYIGKSTIRFYAASERKVKSDCLKACKNPEYFIPNQEEMERPTKHVGEEIKAIYKDLGMTMTQFAEEFKKRKSRRIGAVSTLSEIIKGIYKDSAYEVLAEAKIIKLEILSKDQTDKVML